MVYILLILLFISDKLNLYKDRTEKNVKLTLLTEFFWLAKERRIRTRNNGINKRNILSSLFFLCSFVFSWKWRGSQGWERCFLYFLNMKKRRDYQNVNLCNFV